MKLKDALTRSKIVVGKGSDRFPVIVSTQGDSHPTVMNVSEEDEFYNYCTVVRVFTDVSYQDIDRIYYTILVKPNAEGHLPSGHKYVVIYETPFTPKLPMAQIHIRLKSSGTMEELRGLVQEFLNREIHKHELGARPPMPIQIVDVGYNAAPFIMTLKYGTRIENAVLQSVSFSTMLQEWICVIENEVTHEEYTVRWEGTHFTEAEI